MTDAEKRVEELTQLLNHAQVAWARLQNSAPASKECQQAADELDLVLGTTDA